MELGQRLGVRWGRVRRGSADLDGIARRTIQAFSQRRQQILRRLAALGHRSARAAQAAALSTRPVKERAITQGTLHDRWRHRAAELGLTSRQLAGLLGQARPQDLSSVLADAVRARLGGAEGLTKHRSTFTRREVIQAICDQLPDGARAAEIESVADRFLTDHSVVCPVAPGPPSTSPHRCRATPPNQGLTIALNAQRFSTHELVAIEAQVVDAAQHRRGEGAGVVPREAVTEAVVARNRARPCGASSG